MDPYRVIEVKQSVFADNDKDAEALRRELKEQGTFLVNLMSSPGSGKTTTLTKLLKALPQDMKVGIMEADIDSDVDAGTIAATGTKVIQLHTGGMCHLDADMTRQGVRQLGPGGAGKRGQPGVPRGVRHRRGAEYDDPLRTGGPRQAPEIPPGIPGVQCHDHQ